MELDFATAALEIGFTAEVCSAYQPQQKGAVEAIVKWVKNSFFKQRRFVDPQDLQQQLDEWLHEINTERPSRATDVIPTERLPEERARLRPPRVGPAELALVEPLTVDPTATALIDGHAYELPPDLASRTGTARVYRDRVRIEVGKAAYEFPRGHGSTPTTTPEIRAQRIAGVSGKRGKRYLKRQQILDLGAAAERFLTEVVHADPTAGGASWTPCTTCSSVTARPRCTSRCALPSMSGASRSITSRGSSARGCRP